MATIKRFEELEVWQLSRKLNIKLNPLLEKLDATRNFPLKSQLDSAAGSVMDNIAEGYERGGNRELIQFLSISKGSLGEVRSQIYRVRDRNVITDEHFGELYSDCIDLASKLGTFMTYLSNSEFKGAKFHK